MISQRDINPEESRTQVIFFQSRLPGVLQATLAIALVLGLISYPLPAHSFATKSTAFADEGDSPSSTSRVIAVAYDNSGTMVNDGNNSNQETATDKWCKAMYSLEVLAAMLGEADTMSLFTMSSPGEKLRVEGAEDIKQRVADVRNYKPGISKCTPSSVVEDAYESLLGSNADEKYLFITTDGKYNSHDYDFTVEEDSLDDVVEVVERCKAEGITVIYLGIGDDEDVDLIERDEPNGVYSELVTSENILSSVVNAANLIFNRDSLPDEDLDVSSSQDNLALDVPMSEIVVFAQGENIQIGDLTSSEGELIPGSSASVMYPESFSDDDAYAVKTDRTLQGVVATFGAEGNEIPSGTYSLDISGADPSGTKIYYTPYVDFAMSLVADDGTSYDLGEIDEIPEGTYTSDVSLLDPFTGEVLDSDSDLLTPAEYSIEVVGADGTQSIGIGDQVSLSPGDATLTASAHIKDNVDLSRSYDDINVRSWADIILEWVLRLLPFIIILLIVLYFVYKYMTKPRLPRKMRPHLEFGNQDIPLRYSENKISGKYSPWSHERVTINIAPRNAQDSGFKPRDHFALASVGLVAAKKKNGVRQFVLDEGTVNSMLKHQEHPLNGVDPDYSPAPRPYQRGESYRNRSTFSASGSIRFMGLGNKRPGGGKAKPEEFTLRFK